MFTSPGAVAFELFGMDIRWYGICVAAGVLIGTALSYYRAPKFGISRDNLIDVLLVAIPAGIVGARLYEDNKFQRGRPCHTRRPDTGNNSRSLHVQTSQNFPHKSAGPSGAGICHRAVHRQMGQFLQFRSSRRAD